MYKNFSISFFRSIIKYERDITLNEYHEMVVNGFVSKEVNEIRRLAAEGNTEKAGQIKRMLPLVTIGAVCRNSHRKSDVIRLSGLTVLDIDGLQSDEQRTLCDSFEHDPHVAHINVSPSGNGLKIIVPVLPEHGDLPKELDEAHLFYPAAYRYTADYFAALMHCSIDTSGKDISRCCYLSYDVEAYYNPEAEPLRVPFAGDAKSSSAAKTAKPKKTAGRKKVATTRNSCPSEEAPQHEGGGGSIAERMSHVNDEWIKLFVDVVCINLYRGFQCVRFIDGNRNNFVYQVALMLNSHGVPQPMAAAYLCNHLIDHVKMFENDPEMLNESEIQQTVKSAYGHTEEFATKQLSKDIERRIFMEHELFSLFEIRRNTLKMRVEMRKRDGDGNSWGSFEELSDEVVNDMKKISVYCRNKLDVSEIREIIESSSVPDFEPVGSYLKSLPEWDGHDYIAEVARLVDVPNPEPWAVWLKMFLCGMIANYFDEEQTNHIMLVLYCGFEGGGKSTYVYKLLPPELREYIYEGELEKKDTESLKAVVRNLVVIVDEMDQMSNENLRFLKDIMMRRHLTFRDKYKHFEKRHTHRASFMGTCNSTSFMKALGDRRPIVTLARKFDLEAPINYEQMYAQIKHLIWTDHYKYWPDEADHEFTNAYNSPYQVRSEEYDALREWARLYPPHCKKKIEYPVADIYQHLMKFDKNLVYTNQTRAMLTYALEQQKYRYRPKGRHRVYECHLLTLAQHEYIAQVRKPDAILDRAVDLVVPREILIAGAEAEVEDIRYARQLLDKNEGDMERTVKNYEQYIRKKGKDMFGN